jgi:mercuric ion transport protein
VSSRSTVHTVLIAVAALFAACCVLQIFLAGLGVFERGSAFITHRDFGYLFGILTLAIPILAVIDRSPRRQIAIAIALIVLFALQSVFVAMRTDAPVVAALHPLNGFLITMLAIEFTRYAWVTRPRPDRGDQATGPAGTS